MTSSRPRALSLGPVIGAVVGLVLLAALVAFAVLLPRVAAGEVELPERLPGGFVATDVVNPELGGDAAQQEEFADRQGRFVEATVDELEELVDASASVRAYAGPGGEQSLQITRVEQAPGLFLPEGPPLDPELLELARGPFVYEAVDGATCALNYAEPIAAGAPVPEDDVPARVRCQLEGGTDTWQVVATGMGADQAVELLRGVAE